MNGLTVGGLFDGIGLLAYGLHRAGLEHAWLCEVDEWRRGILAKRFPGVPVIDDVRAVGVDSVSRVDVIAGGFPCKGASTAGKRNGFDHPETVLWREMARAIGELRPRYVLVENVRNILALHDGAVWGEVLGDLAAFGFDVEWDCLPAAAVGAPHLRDRVFAVATDTSSEGRQGSRPGRQALGRAAADDPVAATDAVGEHGELRRAAGEVAREGGAAEGEARQRQRGGDAAGGCGEAAADPEGRSARRDAAQGTGELAAELDGVDSVAVEWGDFGPAVRRWEQVHGPAPEPLLRGVDARPAARVVRSRLSALGDGVQVQVGELVGRYIVEREAERMKAEAA